MIKTLKVFPNEIDPQEIFSSIDRLGRFVMSRDDIFSTVSLKKDHYLEDIVYFLEMDKLKGVGTTQTVFFTPQYTIKMMYVNLDTSHELNIVGSILHPESLKVRGNLILLKYEDETLTNFTCEDLIKVLITRREHTGLHLVNGEFQNVIMDNRWHIGEKSLVSYKKKIINVCNYFLLLVSQENTEITDDNEKYIFNFLDRNKKVLIDFTKEELDLLLTKKDIAVENFDDEQSFNPYFFLKSVQPKE